MANGTPRHDGCSRSCNGGQTAAASSAPVAGEHPTSCAAAAERAFLSVFPKVRDVDCMLCNVSALRCSELKAQP